MASVLLNNFNAVNKTISAKNGYKIIQVTKNNKYLTLVLDDAMTIPELMQKHPDITETLDGQLVIYLCLCGAMNDDCVWKQVNEGGGSKLKCLGTCGCQEKGIIIPKKDPNDPSDGGGTVGGGN